MPNVLVTDRANRAIDKALKILKERGHQRRKQELIQEAAELYLKQLCNDYNCHDEQDIIIIIDNYMKEVTQDNCNYHRIKMHLQNMKGIKFADDRTLIAILNNNFKVIKTPNYRIYTKRSLNDAEQSRN